jgi:uncharacterized damage-inducible protein DinB
VVLQTNRVVAVYRPKTAAGLLARPALTMKPFALAALIESGKLLLNETYVCRRKLQIAGRCSHPAIVRPMTIESALASSCNVFVAPVKMTLMIRTETVLDSWRTVRQDTAQAVEDFPAEEFDFKATPDVMSFGEIARHILEASHALTGMLLEGVDNLATPQFREMIRKHTAQLPPTSNPAELASELRKSAEARNAELAAKPPEFFSHIITRFDGQQVTRLEMLQFVKEHELTHRSQMFMYLRLKGIVPAPTRRRAAKK